MIKQGLLIMGGVLAGTIIRRQFGFIEVQYPHRQTKDLYLVLEPMETWQRTIHCCYQECDRPDFEPQELLEHLVKHTGKVKDNSVRLNRGAEPSVFLTRGSQAG